MSSSYPGMVSSSGETSGAKGSPKTPGGSGAGNGPMAKLSQARAVSCCRNRASARRKLAHAQSDSSSTLQDMAVVEPVAPELVPPLPEPPTPPLPPAPPTQDEAAE